MPTESKSKPGDTEETLEEKIDKIQKQIEVLVKERERLKSGGSA